MTLAWPGWKQPDIAVEVDTARLETSRFKKFWANYVLLCYPSTELKSAFKGSDQRKNRWVWSNVNSRYLVWRCGAGGSFAL